MFTPAGHAAVVTPAGESDSNDIYKIETLRDRPLDEYIKIVRAGAKDERNQSDFIDNYADDASDAFFFAPGVTVNRLDLQEPRIIIRGFAVANSQHRSTVKLLQNAFPLTDVHGTANASEVDLQSTDRVSIYRGVANLREGGDNLGGVVNFISKTGRTARQGVTARVDAGAAINGKPAGQAHIAIAHGVPAGAMDYYAGFTGVYENGFRDNNRRVSEQFHGNIGWRMADWIETRIFADLTNSETELAGGLTLPELLADPDEPSPPIILGPLFPGGPVFNLIDGARQDDFARNVREGRLASQTNIGLLDYNIELGGYYTRRRVESPQSDFSGYINEYGGEWGARVHVERAATLLGREAFYRVGGAYANGNQDSDRYENIGGSKGFLLSQTIQKSKNLSGFFEVIFKPVKRLTVDIGAKFIRVERDLADVINDDDDSRIFTGVAARAGGVYKVMERLEVYVSASRAYEPPSFYELIAEDPTTFNSLEEQDSFTLEAGVRGSLGDWVGWDIAYFDTDVEDEIINTGDPASFVNNDVFENVDKTTRKGVEAGVDMHFFPELMAARDASLTLRNVYGYNNYQYTDAGPLGSLEGNRIPGAPLHLYRGELRYTANGRWFAAANVSYSRGAHYADHVNEVQIPVGAVFGFSAGMVLSDRIELYASGENVTDRANVGGFAPVTSQNLVQARIFTPDARAAVYGGMRYKF
ncbi:TonB-dependent receptor family protein [Hyphococcus sp.]|uniref:TonB-dependent receptor family protein n=1 Tax=Hyphococcus sp. TaxID=2038636 RepID=UPI003CCC44ED